jgi:hypothetical protein
MSDILSNKRLKGSGLSAQSIGARIFALSSELCALSFVLYIL